MASGRHHDHATWALGLPFALLWWPWLGPTGAISGGLGFLIGGLLLSPDLDTRSNATRRWGVLKLLWWPYRRTLSHRSLFSHSPLLGSGLRLALRLRRRRGLNWRSSLGRRGMGSPSCTRCSQLLASMPTAALTIRGACSCQSWAAARRSVWGGGAPMGWRQALTSKTIPAR